MAESGAPLALGGLAEDQLLGNRVADVIRVLRDNQQELPALAFDAVQLGFELLPLKESLVLRFVDLLQGHNAIWHSRNLVEVRP